MPGRVALDSAAPKVDSFSVRYAIVLFVGACGWSPNLGGSDAGDAPRPIDAVDAAPGFRKKVTLTVGSPSQLVDFPVSIVAQDADLAARARADGSDIGMTLVDGTPLSREIVAFDKPSGALEAWVRIPAVSDTLDIYVTYGGGTATAGTTWSSAIYAAAWHLSEATGAWTDTAAGHTVAPATPMTTAQPAAGIIGNARSFDGVDDTSPGADPPDGSLDFGLQSFSVSVWVNVTSSVNGYDMVLDHGGDTALAGYCFTLGTANWYVEEGDVTAYTAARFGGETEMLGHWNHLVAVTDRATNQLHAYANGVLANSVSIATMGSVDTAYGFAIGSATAGYHFKGLADEVRVIKTALSADWIAAEYRNATARAAFVHWASEELY